MVEVIVMVNKIIESDVALKWLEEGNRDYMDSIHNHGDITKKKEYIPITMVKIPSQ